MQDRNSGQPLWQQQGLRQMDLFITERVITEFVVAINFAKLAGADY